MNRPADLKLRGRETLDVLLKCVLTGVRKIYQETRGRNIVVISHVAIIRVLILWYANKSINFYKKIAVPNAEIIRIPIDSHPDF